MTEYISATETARLIRKQLKERLPGQKFYVNTDTYAGGASIDIHWIDGPNENEVKEITAPFEGADFDGMVDLKQYNRAWLTPDGKAYFGQLNPQQGQTIEFTAPTPEAKQVYFGADYIFLHRHLSPGRCKQVVSAVLDKYNIGDEPKYHIGKMWVDGKETDQEVASVDTWLYESREPWLYRELSETLRDTSFYTKPVAVGDQEPKPTQERITITYDREWTWIKFDEKPTDNTLQLLKTALGARFSGRRKAWYVMEQIDEETIKFALAGAL